jgi:hypothetical protein
MTNEIKENGKLVEKQGRKATGLTCYFNSDMTAGLPFWIKRYYNNAAQSKGQRYFLFGGASSNE